MTQLSNTKNTFFFLIERMARTSGTPQHQTCIQLDMHIENITKRPFEFKAFFARLVPDLVLFSAEMDFDVGIAGEKPRVEVASILTA